MGPGKTLVYLILILLKTVPDGKISCNDISSCQTGQYFLLFVHSVAFPVLSYILPENNNLPFQAN